MDAHHRPGFTFVAKLNRPILFLEVDQKTRSLIAVTDSGAHRIAIPENDHE